MCGGYVKAVTEECAEYFAIRVGVESMSVSVSKRCLGCLETKCLGMVYLDSGGGLAGSGLKMLSGFVMARTIFSLLERLLWGSAGVSSLSLLGFRYVMLWLRLCIAIGGWCLLLFSLISPSTSTSLESVGTSCG